MLNVAKILLVAFALQVQAGPDASPKAVEEKKSGAASLPMPVKKYVSYHLHMPRPYPDLHIVDAELLNYRTGKVINVREDVNNMCAVLQDGHMQRHKKSARHRCIFDIYRAFPQVLIHQDTFMLTVKYQCGIKERMYTHQVTSQLAIDCRSSRNITHTPTKPILTTLYDLVFGAPEITLANEGGGAETILRAPEAKDSLVRRQPSISEDAAAEPLLASSK